MNFYLTKLEKYNNGNADKLAIYTFDNINSAVAAFHKQLGSSMDSETVAHVMYMVVDENGDDYKREAWTRPLPEPEPEPTPEPEPETDDSEEETPADGGETSEEEAETPADGE